MTAGSRSGGAGRSPLDPKMAIRFPNGPPLVTPAARGGAIPAKTTQVTPYLKGVPLPAGHLSCNGPPSGPTCVTKLQTANSGSAAPENPEHLTRSRVYHALYPSVTSQPNSSTW